MSNISAMRILTKLAMLAGMVLICAEIVSAQAQVEGERLEETLDADSWLGGPPQRYASMVRGD